MLNERLHTTATDQEAIDILRELHTETEQLLAQLESGAARLYEITTEGTITERTPAVRLYYRNVIRNLQSIIDSLHRSPAADT